MTIPTSTAERDARERRMRALLARLPAPLRRRIEWLRAPGRGWLRAPAGLLLTVGGVLSILPILGLWMLPLGILLLAEDVPLLHRHTGRVLAWMERRWPGLFADRAQRLLAGS